MSCNHGRCDNCLRACTADTARDAIANVERLTGQVMSITRDRDRYREVFEEQRAQNRKLQEQLTAAEERERRLRESIALTDKNFRAMQGRHDEYRDRLAEARVWMDDVAGEFKTFGYDQAVKRIDAALTPAPATTAKNPYEAHEDPHTGETLYRRKGAAFLEFAKSVPELPTTVLATSEPGETQTATCNTCGKPASFACRAHYVEEIQRLRDQVTRNMAVHGAEFNRLATALANVSGALCDAGVVVPDDVARYGEAVREVTKRAQQKLAEDRQRVSDFYQTEVEAHAVTKRNCDAVYDQVYRKLSEEVQAHAATRASWNKEANELTAEIEEQGNALKEARAALALAQQRADAEVERRVTAEREAERLRGECRNGTDYPCDGTNSFRSRSEWCEPCRLRDGLAMRAALGRAVAALREARFGVSWERTSKSIELAARADAILADPTCAAAGEAWRELEAVYEAACRRLPVLTSDPRPHIPPCRCCDCELFDALVAVKQRRGAK